MISEVTEESNANASDTLPEFQAPPGQQWGARGAIWRASARRAAWIQLQERLATPIVGETFGAPLATPVQLQVRLADDWGILERLACPSQPEEAPTDENDLEEWGLDADDGENSSAVEEDLKAMASSRHLCDLKHQPVVRLPPLDPFHLFLIEADGRERHLQQLQFGQSHTFQAAVGSAVRVRKGFTFPPVGTLVGPTAPVLRDRRGRSVDRQAATAGNWSGRVVTSTAGSAWRGEVVWEALVTGPSGGALIIPHCTSQTSTNRLSLLAGSSASRRSDDWYGLRLNQHIRDQASTATSWAAEANADTFVAVAASLSALHKPMAVSAKLNVWRRCNTRGRVCHVCGGHGILQHRPCSPIEPVRGAQLPATPAKGQSSSQRCQQADAVPPGWLNSTGVVQAPPWLGHDRESLSLDWSSDLNPSQLELPACAARAVNVAHAKECPVCGGTGLLRGIPERHTEPLQPSQELCADWGVELQPLTVSGEFEHGVSETQNLQCAGVGHESPMSKPGLVQVQTQDQPDSVWQRGTGEQLAWDAEEMLMRAMAMGTASARQAMHVTVGAWDVATTIELSVDEMLGGWERMLGLPSGRLIVIKVSQVMLPGQAAIVRGLGLPIPKGRQRSTITGSAADVSPGCVRLTGGLGNTSVAADEAALSLVLEPVASVESSCEFAPASTGPAISSFGCLSESANHTGIAWTCEIAESSPIIASQESLERYLLRQRDPDAGLLEDWWIERGVDLRSPSWQDASGCKPSRTQPIRLLSSGIDSSGPDEMLHGDVVLMVDVPALTDTTA